jgi:hypothetical protein
MNTSSNTHLNILDLPNEMLFTIVNKLNMIDVLYSLVDVNERFDRLVLDPLYMRNLDMTTNASLDRTSSIDNQVLDRICEKILPRIHYQVTKLIVEQHSMKRILLPDNYPQLNSLSRTNISSIFNRYTILFCSFLIDKIMKVIRHKLIIVFIF